MRRRLVMAVGGILAVAAVGTAQQAVMMQTAAPAQQQPTCQYRSPFMVGSRPAPTMAPMAMQPTNGMQPVQYIPVQPVQTYSTIPAPTPMNPQVVTPQANNGAMMAQQNMAPANTMAVNAAPMTGPVMMQQGVTTQANSSPINMQTGPDMQMSQTVPSTPVMTNTAPVAQYMMTSNGQMVVMQPQPRQAVLPSAPAAQGVPAQVPVQGGQMRAPMAQPGAPLASNNGVPNTMQGQACPKCGDNNCMTCAPQCCMSACGPDGRFWISAEYLLWWTSGQGVPPLVTGSPIGTPRDQAGVIGAPNTYVLYGDGNLGDQQRDGFRLRFGGWLDNCRTCGLEASYFILNDISEDVLVNGGITARPFINATTGRQDAQLVFYPGVADGFSMIFNSQTFTGFDFNFRKNICCSCCSRTDFLVGFRYLKLEDELYLREAIIVGGTDPNLNPPPGTQIVLDDQFETRNEFYGAQFGLAGEWRRGCFYFDWRALIAFGTTHKTASLEAETTITPPGGQPTTYPGGVYILPSNAGNYSKNDFAVVPEINLNVGYQVTDHFRAFIGYSFLYWSNVSTSGDLINQTVNPTQLPPGTLQGPAQPAFQWHDSNFWAHGINFGGEFRY